MTRVTRAASFFGPQNGGCKKRSSTTTGAGASRCRASGAKISSKLSMSARQAACGRNAVVRASPGMKREVVWAKRGACSRWGVCVSEGERLTFRATDGAGPKSASLPRHRCFRSANLRATRARTCSESNDGVHAPAERKWHVKRGASAKFRRRCFKAASDGCMLRRVHHPPYKQVTSLRGTPSDSCR